MPKRSKRKQRYIPIDGNYLSPIARAIAAEEKKKEPKRVIHEPNTCPECGGPLNTREKFVEKFCLNCGFVVSRR